MLIRNLNLLKKQCYKNNIKCFSEIISPSSPVSPNVPLNSFSIGGEAIEGKPAYLDFQATTPMDPRVSNKYS